MDNLCESAKLMSAMLQELFSHKAQYFLSEPQDWTNFAEQE